MADGDAFAAVIDTVAEWQCIERKMRIEVADSAGEKVVVSVDAEFGSIAIDTTQPRTGVLNLDFTLQVAGGNTYSGQLQLQFV